MKTVGDVMVSPVVTAEPSDSLSDLLNLSRRQRVRHFPVVQGGKVVGIVTDRDLRHAATHPAVYNLLLDLLASLDRGTAEQIMVREVVTIAPDAPLSKAAKLMREHAIGCLPVVGGGKLLGIVTTSDLVEVLSEQ